MQVPLQVAFEVNLRAGCLLKCWKANAAMTQHARRVSTGKIFKGLAF